MCEAPPSHAQQWIADHQDELAQRFEEYEPNEADRRPPELLHRVRAAEQARAAAEDALTKSILEMRIARHSWATIGGLLGISGPAAQRRYESAAETLDILSTPGALEAIQEGLADAEAGRTFTMDDIRAEFGRPDDGGGPAVGAGC